jgi:hypothetical protein
MGEEHLAQASLGWSRWNVDLYNTIDDARWIDRHMSSIVTLFATVEETESPQV